MRLYALVITRIRRTCLRHEYNWMIHFYSISDYIVTSRSLIVFAFLLLLIGLVTVAAQHWCIQEFVLLGFLGPLSICIAGKIGKCSVVRSSVWMSDNLLFSFPLLSFLPTFSPFIYEYRIITAIAKLTFT